MSLETDTEELQKTWQKLENNIRTLALGDGTSDGKDSNFQQYFDKGYSEGYKNGFCAGYYKGAVFAENISKQINLTEHEYLDKPKLGWCQICSKKDEGERSLSQVISEQTQTSNGKVATLNKEYSSKVSLKLPTVI